MQEEFWRRLRAKIAEMQKTNRDNLARGMAVNFSEYRYWCGYEQALQDVLDVSADTIKRLAGD